MAPVIGCYWQAASMPLPCAMDHWGVPAVPAKHLAGFTLIELMVALAVLLILTVLAVPSFTTYLDKSRVRGAADEVISALAQARQAGVKFDRGVRVATTGSGATWCLGANQAATPAVGNPMLAPDACNCTVADACIVDGQRLVVASADHPGVTLTSPPGILDFDGRLGIRTDPNVGNAAASSFDLTSPRGRYVLTVNVSQLGQATVCSKQGNILGYPAC
jgi:type IV fimbrial biogenesis protein FimT